DIMLDRMSQRLYGMRKLIGDLLDLTRIESGSSKRELKKIKIKPIVEQVLDGYKEEASSRNISITLSCDNEIEMTADGNEIEMLFNNFISNGIKYNKDNGSLKIEISKDNNLVKLIVSDTGIGMTEEEQQKLFKEFSRIKNEKTRNISGSGLGLSIVEKIVKLYDGKIEVKSIPDEGTTFIVELEDKPT
ncbi:MAG: HAMP domain-containing histidine kinase, partial [Chitinispirillaceae bacterium]|nr:HAMP domain-containing histidine kinase [Chitinispirillaceae bacterium]